MSATFLDSKNVSQQELLKLREMIEPASEKDYGSLMVITGKHPVAGDIALISSPETSGCLVLSNNLDALA